MTDTKRKLVTTLCAIAAIILLALIIWRFHSAVADLLHAVGNRQALINDFQSDRSPLDLALFTALLILLIWIPGAPYSVLAIVAGFGFGHWTGFAMNVIAATIGNFSVATVLPKLSKKDDRHTKSRLYQDLLKIQHPQLGIMLGYAIPFVPSMIVNLAAEKLVPDKHRLFLLCCLGSMPTAALYAFGGDATLRGNTLRLVIIIVIALILFGGILIIRKDRKRRDNNAA